MTANNLRTRTTPRQAIYDRALTYLAHTRFYDVVDVIKVLCAMASAANLRSERANRSRTIE